MDVNYFDTFLRCHTLSMTIVTDPRPHFGLLSVSKHRDGCRNADPINATYGENRARKVRKKRLRV